MVLFEYKKNKKKPYSKRSIFGSSLLSGLVMLPTINHEAFANTRSYVAVEPLTCELVEAIALPTDNVTCLIDRDKDVHDVKFTPQQLQLLNSADLIFTLGKEMTPAIKNWEDKKNTVVIGVTAIDIDSHGDHDDHEDHDDHVAHDDHDDHDDHHHDHGGLDPHVWHDPHNIVKMAEIVKDNLKSQLGRFNSDRNLINESFMKVELILEDLDEWIVAQVETVPESERIIVSKHKALEHYGDAFGFEIVSLLDYLGESSSLRPDNLREVLKGIKENDIRVIFIEQYPPSKLIKNLSRQSSVPLSEDRLYVDGLMLDGNLITVAIHNTCTIVNSLGGKCDEEVGSSLENEWNQLDN